MRKKNQIIKTGKDKKSKVPPIHPHPPFGPSPPFRACCRRLTGSVNQIGKERHIFDYTENKIFKGVEN